MTSRPCSATRQSSCAFSDAGAARKWRYSPIRNCTRASTGASIRMHSAARMRLEEGVRNLELPDLLAFGLDEDRPVRVQLPQAVPDARLEHLLRWLRRVGQIAEHRAAVRRELLEVEHLRARRGERLQQPALRAAGLAADDEVAELARLGGEPRDDFASIRLVSAVELCRLPADFAQDVRHRPRALAAAPAVHERPPAPVALDEARLEVAGDVAGHERGAELLRLERRDLPVHRPDARALRVVEDREIRGARDVVLGELGRRAHVDHLGEEVDLACADDFRKLHLPPLSGRLGPHDSTHTTP